MASPVPGKIKVNQSLCLLDSPGSPGSRKSRKSGYILPLLQFVPLFHSSGARRTGSLPSFRQTSFFVGHKTSSQVNE